jgi:hypothetical protein
MLIIAEQIAFSKDCSEFSRIPYTILESNGKKILDMIAIPDILSDFFSVKGRRGVGR